MARKTNSDPFDVTVGEEEEREGQGQGREAERRAGEREGALQTCGKGDPVMEAGGFIF